MRKNIFLVIGLLMILGVSGPEATAQFPMKIPKIKVEKPRTEQPRSDNTDAAAGNNERSAPGQPAARGDSRSATVGGRDQPTIAKDSIQVRAFTFSVYRKNYDIWSWVPEMQYVVNGPIASGSQLYVEFNIPSAGPWLKFDCKTEATGAGYGSKTECGGRQIPEDKGAIHTGTVNFSIQMRNELLGTNMTLFTGKVKVAKVRSNEEGPKAANHFVYYVDHDWNLPIGYVFYESDNRWDPDDPRRWAKPKFSLAFWTRGESNGFAEPHLFFGGKEASFSTTEGK